MQYKNTNYIAKEKETNYEIHTDTNVFVCNLPKRIVEENPDRVLIN